MTQPFPDRKFDGLFTITTELSPMASPSFEVGRSVAQGHFVLRVCSNYVFLTVTKFRQTEQETILSRLLEKAIRRSNALDTESLCLLAGQKCWNVRVDLHVIDYDGGLVDTSCIAVVTALQHFRRPDAGVQGEEVIIYSLDERAPIQLSMLHHPLCVTLSFFYGGEVVVVDATLHEQQMSEGEMIVTANRHGEVCQIAKLGGVPTDALVLLRAIESAVQKVTQLHQIVSIALEKDEKTRTPKNLLKELSAQNSR